MGLSAKILVELQLAIAEIIAEIREARKGCRQEKATILKELAAIEKHRAQLAEQEQVLKKRMEKVEEEDEVNQGQLRVLKKIEKCP